MGKNILFVEPFKNSFLSVGLPKSLEPNVSVLRSIALLRKKYNVDFLDLKIGSVSRSDFIEKVQEIEYAYCFIEVKTYNRYFVLELIELIRSYCPDTIICCFGQHVSCEPEFILARFSDLYILQKEIDAFFRAFSQKDELTLDIKDLPNIIYTSNGQHVINPQEEITDLDGLPFIDLQILHQNKYYTLYPMQSVGVYKWGFLTLSKGCAFDCVYCSQTLRVSYGKKIYHFSVLESIVRIRCLVEAGFNYIRFLDDNFLCSKQYVLALCEQIIAEKISFKWMAQVRADCVDSELLSLMKKAGCECLNIGVESGSNKILKVLKKSISVKQIRDCFAECHEYGLYTVAYVMIGCPEEDIDDLRLTTQLIKDIAPTMLQVAYFTPYPNSEYYKQLSNVEKSKEAFFHYSGMVSNFSKMSDKEVKLFVIYLYLSFYLNPKNFIRLGFYRICSFIIYPLQEIRIFTKALKYIFN